VSSNLAKDKFILFSPIYFGMNMKGFGNLSANGEKEGVILVRERGQGENS